MTPVQSEAGADRLPTDVPRPCQECNGEKVVATRTCSHVGNCPCGAYVEEPCPRCEGSGVESCNHCGEPAAIRYLGQDLCEACAPSEEQRFSCCSLCDRAIDIRESAIPLCASCEGTARVAGQQAADARRYPDPDRERVA